MHYIPTDICYLQNYLQNICHNDINSFSLKTLAKPSEGGGIFDTDLEVCKAHNRWRVDEKASVKPSPVSSSQNLLLTPLYFVFRFTESVIPNGFMV